MKEIYNDVMARLDTVPELTAIDIDAGQPQGSGIEASGGAVALVNIAYTKTEDVVPTLQSCTVEVCVTVVCEAGYGDTSSTAPQPWRDAALRRMDVVDAVHRALQGWGNDRIGTLSRISMIPDPRDDGRKAYRIYYTTSFEEDNSPEEE